MEFKELVVTEGQATIGLKHKNDDVYVSIMFGGNDIAFVLPRQALDSFVRVYEKVRFPS
jgi:hypothetical protein